MPYLPLLCLSLLSLSIEKGRKEEKEEKGEELKRTETGVGRVGQSLFTTQDRGGQ